VSGAQRLARQSGAGARKSSAQAGLLPISLAKVPVEALAGMPVFIRVGPRTDSLGQDAQPGTRVEGFRAYSGAEVRFTDFHRRRLQNHDVRFIYIRVTDQARLYKQLEAGRGPGAGDVTDAIFYEASVELMNELLEEPDLLQRSLRLEQYTRSIVTLVLNRPEAFRHVLAACRHDFYTAAHMLSVATWIVPLAHELGHTSSDALGVICEAGLLHDIGMLSVPAEVLNKKGKLDDAEWRLVKSHPQAGHALLSAREGIDPLILRAALEHHERADGSGYPKGLRSDDTHEVSRMCAVVDSFAAMTSFRPFKDRPLTTAEAIACLHKEQGRYDTKVLDTFAGVMTRPEPGGAPPAVLAGISESEQRTFARRNFQCPALVQVVGEPPGAQDLKVITRNISRSGLGFLSHQPIDEGEVLRVYLQAKGWEKRALEGRVVRCRSYDQKWHEVGMKFSTSQDQPAPPATA
jgi:HD-GYP domain-containing protein (c-di-GMP phosphodiesterase class II)